MSLTRPLTKIHFPVFSIIQEITLPVEKLLGLQIAILTPNVPGQHMWLSPGPWPGPDSKCSNTVEDTGRQIFMLRLSPRGPDFFRKRIRNGVLVFKLKIKKRNLHIIS